MTLSVIVRNDLSSAASLSGGLEEIKNPPQQNRNNCLCK